MDAVTLGQLRDVLLNLGTIAGALLAVWAALHLMVVAPIKRWIRANIKAPLVRLEQRFDEHVEKHPGPTRFPRPPRTEAH